MTTVGVIWILGTISLCHTSAELITCSDSFKGSILTPPQAGFGTFSPILEHQHWPLRPRFLLSSFCLPTPSQLGTKKQTNSSGSCRICRVWLPASLEGPTWVPARAQTLTEAFPTVWASIKCQLWWILQCLIRSDSMCWFFSQLQPWQGHSLSS